nr:hypothetical protein [Brevundimonas diminuta]
MSATFQVPNNAELHVRVRAFYIENYVINIPPIIERINALLDQNTDATVTYAALEAHHDAKD